MTSAPDENLPVLEEIEAALTSLFVGWDRNAPTFVRLYVLRSGSWGISLSGHAHPDPSDRGPSEVCVEILANADVSDIACDLLNRLAFARWWVAE